MRLVEALDEAGVTKGAINLVTGPGSKVGNEIVTNPDVKAISFTGSEGTGSQIAVEAAKRRARVQLEMGGKNPTIVLADADIADAVNVVVNAAFFSTGQKLHRDLARHRRGAHRASGSPTRWSRARKPLKVGNGLEAGIDIGPSIDEKQLGTVLDYVGVGEPRRGAAALRRRAADDGRARARLLLVAGGDDRRRPGDARRAGRDLRPGARRAAGRATSTDAIEIANGIRFGLSAGDLHALADARPTSSSTASRPGW